MNAPLALPLLLLLLLPPCTLALAQDGRRHHKPSASLSPPGEFNCSTRSTTATNPTTEQHSTSPMKPTTPKTTKSPTHSPSTPGKTTKSPTHSPSTASKTTKSPTHSPSTAGKTTQATHSSTHHSTVHSTMHPVTTPASPKPTPSTTLEVGNYTVKNSFGALCVFARMAVQIEQSIFNPNETGTFIIQPNKTRAQGNCEDPRANLTLVFAEGNLSFHFQKNTTSNSVYVDFVSFDINYPIVTSGPGRHSAANDSVNLFGVAVSRSYQCSNVSVYMGHGYRLDVTHVRIQAFNFTTNDQFDEAVECPQDKTSYSVAIAVGIVLLILIIIVVVAYFIGRRKRTDGYQSL